MTELIFDISILMILYAYLGYPVIIWIISKIYSKPVKKETIYPFVSIVISVYNEEKNIERKIKNCIEMDYPKDKLEILIGSDGSNDKTNEIVENIISDVVKFYNFKTRQGKISVLNYLIPKAKGDIILFADSRQIFEKNVLKEIVNNFADQKVGCVSGELILKGSENSNIGEGIGLYWNYEKFLRKTESIIDSMLGATGAIYAIRKNLFISPPSDMLLDDVYIPLKIVEQGYRAVFESNAKAYDEVSKTSEAESKRKIRTLAGNWQIFVKLKNMFNPFTCRVAVQLFSHKLLRVLVPYFLIIAFGANIFLMNSIFYQIFFILQSIFYLFAILGFMFVKYKIKIFNIAYTFCMLNIDAIRGLYVFLSNKQKVTWVK